MLKRILLIVVSLSFTAASYGAKIYDANQVLGFTRIASVSASPNGSEFAFVTWKRNPKNENTWLYTLWLKDKANKAQRLVTGDYISALNWSPVGGRIAFVLTKGDNNTLMVYHLKQKKMLAVLRSHHFIDALSWSPNSESIAFTSAQQIPSASGPSVLTNPAHGNVNTVIYLISTIRKNAHYHAITPTRYNVSAGLCDGGFSWSMNGKRIAFAYTPSAKTVDSAKSRVAVLNVATRKIEQVSFCRRHYCASPMFAPNGKWLAFSANIIDKGKAEILRHNISTQNQVCVMGKNGQTHCLQNTFNKTPQLIGWAPGSQAVYVGDVYKTFGLKIYALNVNNTVPVKIISRQKNFIEPATLSLNNTGTMLAYGAESINKAPEVFSARLPGFETKQLTHINTARNHRLGHVQVLDWLSNDKTKIEGLLITPVNFNPKHHYPLYVDVHGGPASAQRVRYLGGCDEYSVQMAPTTCPANILSLGYIILQVNYRGSNDYGIGFRVKNFRDFGGGDYHDIMSGIHLLISKGMVNTHNIAISGWSNGGYLTLWAIEHSDIFHTAIEGDSISDFISYTGTTDDTDFFQRYLGSYFWQSPKSSALYWHSSPITYVKSIKTPLLMFQGAQDVRVPPSQSQELYTALTMLHRPVTMYLASNQGHEPTDPATLSAEIKVIDAWLVHQSKDDNK